LVCLSALAMLCVTHARQLSAQPIDAPATDPAVTDPASSPATPTVELQQAPNRIRQQLAQLEALSANNQPADPDQAEAQWIEAIELLETILSDPQSQQTVIQVGPDRFVSLANYCHIKLSQMPAGALRIYRDAVDAAAEQQYERAVAARDEAALSELVDQAFCSGWGDDALLALADMALERGDFVSARRHCRRIAPLLSDPAGRSLDWTLHDIDLDQHAAEVLRRLHAAHARAADEGATGEGGTGEWLVYPDTDLPIHAVLARMISASIRERAFQRAATELKLLRQLAPHATGRIAGRETPLAQTLSQTLAAQLDEATPSPTAWSNETQTVGPLVGRLWPEPWRLAEPPPPPAYLARSYGATLAAPAARLCRPVPWRRAVLFRDGATLRALDLASGKPAITKNGQLHTASPQLATPGRRSPAMIQRGIFFSPSPRSVVASPITDPVTIEGDAMYVRLPGEESSSDDARGTGLHIVGRDLVRENLTVLDLSPPSSPWAFGSPPLVARGRLFVALVADDVRPRVAVACYSQATGRPLWQTTIGSGPPPAGFQRSTAPQPRLTLVADGICVNTNFGAIAMLNQRRGSLEWVKRYATQSAQTLGSNAQANSHASSCLASNGRLYAAPDDAVHLLALDGLTGQTLWQQERPAADVTLLGVVGRTLVASGQRLTGLDTETGATRYHWPDSPKAGLRGMGVGCVAGTEVFWPTRNRLFALDALDAAQTRESIDIADLGGAGATVTPAAGCLIVAGTRAVTVLGPAHRQHESDATQLSASNPFSLDRE